jgi:hypothetical protein
VTCASALLSRMSASLLPMFPEGVVIVIFMSTSQ